MGACIVAYVRTEYHSAAAGLNININSLRLRTEYLNTRVPPVPGTGAQFTTCL
jgi:hypothetical protein